MRRSEFWDDLERDLADPEFRTAFRSDHARTLTVDRIVNDLEAQRVSLGITKAELARHLQTSAPAIRRLLTHGETNPKLATIVDVAGALGLRVTLEPIPAEDSFELPRPAKSHAS